MMSDSYIDKEDNSRVKDVILAFLTSDEVSLNKIDAEDPEVIRMMLMMIMIMIPRGVGLHHDPRHWPALRAAPGLSSGERGDPPGLHQALKIENSIMETQDDLLFLFHCLHWKICKKNCNSFQAL